MANGWAVKRRSPNRLVFCSLHGNPESELLARQNGAQSLFVGRPGRGRLDLLGRHPKLRGPQQSPQDGLWATCFSTTIPARAGLWLASRRSLGSTTRIRRLTTTAGAPWTSSRCRRCPPCHSRRDQAGLPLSDMVLVRRSRLSVTPVKEAEYGIVLAMGGWPSDWPG